jgi:hypothetical protein
MVKETRLTGVRFLRELHDNTNQCCLVLNLLNEPPERNVLEVLLLRLTHLDLLLPTIVLTNDDTTDTMLDAQVHNEFGRMMKVILNLEVPFPARPLVGMLVIQPIDTLDDTTVDQYRTTELTGSYRSQVVYANVDATHFVLVQVFEAVKCLCLLNKDVQVGQSFVTEPCFPHEEVALVVQFLALGAESDDFGRAVYQMSFYYEHVL